MKFLSTMRIKTKRQPDYQSERQERQTTYFASIAESTTHKGAAVLVKEDQMDKWVLILNQGRKDRKATSGFSLIKELPEDILSATPAGEGIRAFLARRGFSSSFCWNFWFPCLFVIIRENRLGIWRRGRSSNKSAGEIFRSLLCQFARAEPPPA